MAAYSQGLSEYSPADFEDAEDTRPSDIFLDPTATGSQTPYTNVVTNAVARQTLEIREKAGTYAFTTTQWRRRMKEFLIQKNDSLLKFLPKPLSQHPVLGSAEQFMRRFGRIDFQANHASLRDVCLDGSGVDMKEILEKEIQTHGASSVQELSAQIRYILDKYRESGETLLTKENQLLQRLAILDKVQQKLIQMNDMPMNEASGSLCEAMEKYMEKVFEEHKIEELYEDFMTAFRRFVSLREMVQFLRTTDMSHQEPLCSICLEEMVSYALVPCGHTFCQNCGRRQTIQCYICRANIREKTKIFFG
jgi:hypothetical protein